MTRSICGIDARAIESKWDPIKLHTKKSEGSNSPTFPTYMLIIDTLAKF